MLTKKIPRGLRNNNPGNIRNLETNDFQGEVKYKDKKDAEFEEFVAMKWGVRAMMKILLRYNKRYACRNLEDLIRHWAPENENNTAAYIKKVCTMTGLNPKWEVDLSQKDTMCSIVDAMIYVENGQHISMEEIEDGWNML